jgi:hypothetical protein
MSTLNDPYKSPTITRRESEAETLIEKYRHEIQKMEAYINDQDVDYLVALSRSGPRLLERFRKQGVIDLDPKVITEKSLRTMKREDEISESEFILFDDIVIAGTTLWTELSEFTDKYHSNIRAVTLAIDIDTVGLFNPEQKSALPDEEVLLECGQEQKTQVPFKTFSSLDKKQRFEFSKDLVHSVSKLNKPYDMDFAIFNTSGGPEFRRWLRTHERVQELTTVAQRESGLERYSLLVSKETTNAFQRTIFASQDYDAEISKLRVYYDRESGNVTLVPIFLFSLDESMMKGDDPVFNPEWFGQFNEIVDRITSEYVSASEPAEKKQKIQFRVTWYLVSYAFGLFLNEHVNSCPSELITGSLPEHHIQYTDLLYLFGDEAGKEILGELNTWMQPDDSPQQGESLQHIRSVVKDISMSRETGEISFEVEPPQEQREGKIDSGEEDDRKKVWREVYDPGKEDLRTKLSDDHGLQGNIAVIFEQMYKNLEVEKQKKICEINGDYEDMRKLFPDWVERLRVGFTVPQIAGVLEEYTDFSADNLQDLQQLSLAIDLLVDKGEQVPIFYKCQNDEEWVRAYRHGESAYISYEEFKSVMSEVFDYISGDEGFRDLTNVAIEKIALLVWRYMYSEGYVDELREGGKDAIKVQNTFLPFGSSVSINEDPDIPSESEEPPNNPLQGDGSKFYKWAKINGVINENHGEREKRTIPARNQYHLYVTPKTILYHTRYKREK